MEPSQDPVQETPIQENPEPHYEAKPSDLIEDYKEGEHDDQPHTDPNIKTDGTMRAAFIEEFNKPLVVKQVPIPKPASGEVLIKVEAAPINPSDLAITKGGDYGKAPLPIAAGREGAGTVMASGGGLMARAMVGRRVAFGCAVEKSGTWGEYAITPAMQCFPIDKSIPFEQAACAVVNPFTAIAFLEILKKDKAKAVVQTAAASQLGRMIIKLLKKEGIKTINLVRKDEQKKMLEELGADVVISTEEKGFEEELRKKAAELHAVHLLECICGDVTTKVIKAMPRDSIIFIYGHLDQDPLTDVDFTDILTNNKTIKPFYMPNWMNEQGILTKVGIVRKVQKLLQSELKTEVAKTFTVDQINEAIEYYKKNMTAGKIIVKPH